MKISTIRQLCFYSFDCETSISTFLEFQIIINKVYHIFYQYGINTEEFVPALNFYKMPDDFWIKDLNDAPRFYLSGSEEFTSLCDVGKRLKYEIKEYIELEYAEHFKECGLGFLLIEKLRKVFTTQSKNILWLGIINEHLAGGPDAFECKIELIEKGFGAHTKL
ncbi:MAG: hypothetical protein QXN55_01170 [Candidatus Nitrosotenuis sp.]